MNDMNDNGPARDSNPQPLADQANALPTELLGCVWPPEKQIGKYIIRFVEQCLILVIWPQPYG